MEKGEGGNVLHEEHKILVISCNKDEKKLSLWNSVLVTIDIFVILFDWYIGKYLYI